MNIQVHDMTATKYRSFIVIVRYFVRIESSGKTIKKLHLRDRGKTWQLILPKTYAITSNLSEYQINYYSAPYIHRDDNYVSFVQTDLAIAGCSDFA